LSITRLHEHSAPKTVKSCQNKYTTVSFLISFLSYLGYRIAEQKIKFCKVYCIMCTIQLVSGWAWDDETGTSITINLASSWEDYVKKNPQAKPFQNKGGHISARLQNSCPQLQLVPMSSICLHPKTSPMVVMHLLPPKANPIPVPPVTAVQQSVDTPIEVSNSETEVCSSLSYFILLLMFSDW
jgi:hypothetical protein